MCKCKKKSPAGRHNFSADLTMPADFYMDTELRCVFSKAVGEFSRADAFDHMTRMIAHPDFDPSFNQLGDFREVQRMDLSGEDIRNFATRSIYAASSKRAFVVSTDVQFGLGRMFETYRGLDGENGVRIFRSMSDAIQWVGLLEEPNAAKFTNLQPKG
jgi:hypothetical protein